jgi:5'-phosphate synthase pdxT subunit
MVYKVAVVGVQGDVEEHVLSVRRAFEELGIEGKAVATRKSGVVSESDAVVIPGGESTTISKLIFREGIADEIIQLAKDGKPVMGTCAGLILLSMHGDEQVERTKTKLLGLMDIWVKRNAFGRQRESFQVNVDIKGIGPFDAVFIRAPAITKVGEYVDVLATYKDYIIAAKQENILGLSFHPELTDDTRVHEYFIKMGIDL